MATRGRTIALIDDDIRVLESLVNLLASSGYKAESYSSAEQFLGADGLSRASCIVTDLEMRHMSGLGLLQYVKSVANSIPVVIITGKSTDNPESFYLEKGAVGFFRKPVDGDALLNRIAAVCLAQ